MIDVRRHKFLCLALLHVVGVVFLCNVFVWTPAAQAVEPDPVVLALSGRHGTPDAAALESLAGGEDQLIARLLELRRSTQLPFIAIRAEKILVEYAARPDVQAALLDDLQDPRAKGLARVVAAGVDRVPDKAARRKLAGAVAERSKRDAEFGSFKKALADSRYPEVRAAAKN